MANRILVEDALWKEIRKRAATSKRLTAVVGYLGRHPGSVLRWPKSSEVICDLSKDCVSRGASSARGARELLKKGVPIHSMKRLHAKIYIFDSSAIVCSANLSESSSTLQEAGVVIRDSAEVKELRAYARRLKSAASRIDDDAYLKELAKLEPKRKRTPKGTLTALKKVSSVPFFENDPVWIQTCSVDDGGTKEEEQRKRAEVKSAAHAHGVEASHVDWLNECGLKTKRALEEDHFVVFWYEPSSRAKKATFGWLEGPWVSLGGIDLGKKFGGRRYCVRSRRESHARFLSTRPPTRPF